MAGIDDIFGLAFGPDDCLYVSAAGASNKIWRICESASGGVHNLAVIKLKAPKSINLKAVPPENPVLTLSQRLTPSTLRPDSPVE